MDTVMMISKKSTPTSGRIFGRDFIYRTRKVEKYYGITGLKMFTRIDFGKRSFYWWNMQGVISTKARDYVIHATK